jgi:hypothetical protein
MGNADGLPMRPRWQRDINTLLNGITPFKMEEVIVIAG